MGAPRAVLSMPFFPHADPVSLRAGLDWALQLPGMPPFGPPEGDASATTVSIPGGYIALGTMPAPIPASDLALPIQAAWHWPQAAEVIARHRSHVICHASSATLTALQLHLLHSRVVAGLVVAGAGTGVWVGGSGLVREGADYVRDMEVAGADSLPLISWVGFNMVADGGMRSAYTAGLAGFGLLELELRDTKLDWDPAFRLLANVAHYEIASGTQIRDGETLGATEADKKLVRHLDSTYFPGTKSAVIAA